MARIQLPARPVARRRVSSADRLAVSRDCTRADAQVATTSSAVIIAPLTGYIF